MGSKRFPQLLVIYQVLSKAPKNYNRTILAVVPPIGYPQHGCLRTTVDNPRRGYRTYTAHTYCTTTPLISLPPQPAPRPATNTIPQRNNADPLPTFSFY